MKKIYFGHPGDIDYQTLYDWIGASDIAKENNIVLPHANGRHENTIQIIKTSDLFVAEVSRPSTGLGIELGIAFDHKIPIVCLYRLPAKPSMSLSYITPHVEKYADQEEFIARIKKFL
ncbi:MAG: nucleoside 2-deoxyribosyltransferase [Lactobacillales bacterium]|jgi:hypothetical protein|nr:nucleoside 2-deoxyribosyltransferase [Lactobacillales bacterium]